MATRIPGGSEEQPGYAFSMKSNGHSTQKSTKISIPHSLPPECTLVGVLEQVQPNETTKGRKLALIVHGLYGHKDYLYQKKLALRLHMDSFRYDLRGNAESTGDMRVGGMKQDVEDLKTVVSYLQNNFGYVVDIVIAHSRGGLVAFNWMCTEPQQVKDVTGFVNVSARYRMDVYARDLVTYKPSFEKQGYHSHFVKIGGKTIEFRTYPDDIPQGIGWDTSMVWDKFPPKTHVLTLQGLADQLVPPYDGILYARALGARSAGTHSLHLIEGADHNYGGKREELIETVLDWLEAKEKGTLTTGVWGTGIRGKL